jgi:transposase
VAARNRTAAARVSEVADEEHQQLFTRVAAVDVAKASGMVCTRLPKGRGYTARTWEVTAVMSAVVALARQLAGLGIEIITLESTSDYWRIWYYVFEQAGLRVQLVSPDQARQLRGRPKTDRLDAQWLARLTQWGLLRPSFVPPSPVRVLRQLTRARTGLVRDRTRCWQRLEKLLEDALIKVSSVASKLTTDSAKAMVAALIEGERDPRVLAGMALGRMRSKHGALVQALDGMFQIHHGVLAAQLSAQIAFLDEQIRALEPQIAAALAEIPAAWGADGDGVTGPGAGHGPDAAVLAAADRLAEVHGLSRDLAISVIAETGLDMTRFPTAGHLVSWGGLCPVEASSAARRKTRKGRGNKYLRGYLGQAANAARNTDSFLGERYRRIARRRGSARAQVAVARSILVIIWQLLADPAARYQDLGAGWHAARTDKDKKIRNLRRQLAALEAGTPATQTA